MSLNDGRAGFSGRLIHHAMTGDMPRAAGALRRAADCRVEGEAGTRNRLTYLMNLGRLAGYVAERKRYDEADEL